MTDSPILRRFIAEMRALNPDAVMRSRLDELERELDGDG